MKLSQPALLTCILLTVALQNCSLTGNEASKTQPQLLVVKDTSIYLSHIQSDTNKVMVSLTNYLQPLFTDFIYNTPQNFTKKVLYSNPEAFLRVPAAKALQQFKPN